jgi:hypothetical protein
MECQFNLLKLDSSLSYLTNQKNKEKYYSKTRNNYQASFGFTGVNQLRNAHTGVYEAMPQKLTDTDQFWEQFVCLSEMA